LSRFWNKFVWQQLAVTREKGRGTTVAKHTRMKSSATKFIVLVSITLSFIGCASQPAMTTTSTTAQTTNGPLERGNGLASMMH
jgi:hypothetical protein